MVGLVFFFTVIIIIITSTTWADIFSYWAVGSWVPQHRLICGEKKAPESCRLGSLLGRQKCVCFQLSGNTLITTIDLTPLGSGWKKIQDTCSTKGYL